MISQSFQWYNILNEILKSKVNIQTQTQIQQFSKVVFFAINSLMVIRIKFSQIINIMNIH